MGLDLSISTDIDDIIYSGDYYDLGDSLRNQHALSRTFCTLMGRNRIENVEPEIEQVQKLANVQLECIFQMEINFGEYDEELEFLLEAAETEEEKNLLRQQAQQRKNKIRGNIDLIGKTVSQMLSALSKIENLDSNIVHSKFYKPFFANYFKNFNADPGDGYIGNNFGQDLRNFLRFVEFAKAKGATTVYFSYG